MKAVLIWGTGEIGKNVYERGLNARVAGFVETYRSCTECKGLPVYQVTTDELPAYDYIVVANAHVIDIYDYMKDKGMDLARAVFMCFCPKVNPRENIEVAKEVLSYQNFQRYCITYKLIDKSFYADDRELYTRLNKREQFKIQEEFLWPVITEKYDANAGTVNNYFVQDLWAASLIHKKMPKIHYDIGSRLDGFIAHVLAMGIPVTMIDIRPFPGKIEGLDTIVDDATYLNQFSDNSIESLSALCSLEHFGLGRYGDPIDPEACFKCFSAIQRKMKPEGNLYIAVPVGKERVEFNAHRVFYAQTIRDCFGELQLMEFSCAVAGNLEKNIDIHKFDNDVQNGASHYGLFHFVKKGGAK